MGYAPNCPASFQLGQTRTFTGCPFGFAFEFWSAVTLIIIANKDCYPTNRANCLCIHHQLRFRLYRLIHGAASLSRLSLCLQSNTIPSFVFAHIEQRITHIEQYNPHSLYLHTSILSALPLQTLWHTIRYHTGGASHKFFFSCGKHKVEFRHCMGCILSYRLLFIFPPTFTV